LEKGNDVFKRLSDLEAKISESFEFTEYVRDPRGRYVEYLVDPKPGVDVEEGFSRVYDEAVRLGYYVILTKTGSTLVLRALLNPSGLRERRRTLAVTLFIATVVSVSVTGYIQTVAYNDIVYRLHSLGVNVPPFNPVMGALVFTAAVLIPILAHELGHFLIARRTSTPATFPLPIPAPIISPLGTFGAIIQMRHLPKRLRDLAYLGIAGPLTGVILAIVFFTISYVTSPAISLSSASVAVKHGLLAPVQIVPLSTLAVSFMVAHLTASGEKVIIMNPAAYAAFLILLIHFANLLPIGQLDGGHVFRSLTNVKVHRAFSLISTLLLVLASFIVYQLSWLGFFAILAFMLTGLRPHYGSANMLSKLKRRDKFLVGLTYVVLLALTTPIPVPASL